MLKKIDNKFKILSLLVLIAFVFSLFKLLSTRDLNGSVTFGVSQIAFSSDPLDYDYLTHHLAFSSVYAKLVSKEKNGEMFPMLASSWSNSNNFKEWKFKIRKDLTYSDGSKISIEDIQLNFKRLVYLKNKNNSNSGFLEFIEGFKQFNSMSSNVQGIRFHEDMLLFTFIKPMPDLLERISFGFYGLAHPSLYNQSTGEWINKMNVISSGPYRVSSWDKEKFELSLREDVLFNDTKNGLKLIKFAIFTDIKNAKELRTIDFLVAEKGSLLVSDEFEYVGSAEKLKMGYVQVNAALDKKSPLYRKEVREWFRHKFYLGFEKNNFPITGSFFPQTLRGIKPLNPSHFVLKPDFKPFTIRSDPFTFSAKLEENKNKMSIIDYFSDAINSIGEDSGANLILELRDDNLYDLEILGSGIEASNYWDTIRFMFLSKEGIKLPDITGKIKEELKKENPDINYINQEMWDQAVIWPIRHYSSGYWFNKKSKIDYSEMNFDSPAIDFQFLRWKD